ncbi:hypothetical protein BGZ58_006418, partial [Dissophora ornata]
MQKIVYHSDYFEGVQSTIWDILVSMPRLRHLELLRAHVGEQTPSQCEAFVKICERLETMHLKCSSLCDWPSFEQGEQRRFSKMKQLEFMFTEDAPAQLQMIRQ